MLQWKDKGNALFAAEDYNGAIACYTNAIDIERQIALFSNRSAAYLKLREYQLAIADADICIQIDPKWAKGWWRKGQALIESGDPKKAIRVYESGLEYQPRDRNLIEGRREAISKAAETDASIASVYHEQMVATRSEKQAVENPVTKESTEPSSHAAAPSAPSASDIPEAKPSSAEKEPITNQNGISPEPTVEEPKAADAPSVKNTTEGENVWPGTAEQEVERIRKAANHYAVLHVHRDAAPADIKKNYYTLAKMLHPDKCQLDGAAEAMSQVSQAYDTLNNPIKKKMYDNYVDDMMKKSGAEGKTFAEWEAENGRVELPKWLDCMLKVKGCAFILLFILILILIPLVILVVVLYCILAIICIPLACVQKCFCPEQYEARKAAAEKAQQDYEEQMQYERFQHV